MYTNKFSQWATQIFASVNAIPSKNRLFFKLVIAHCMLIIKEFKYAFLETGTPNE